MDPSLVRTNCNAILQHITCNVLAKHCCCGNYSRSNQSTLLTLLGGGSPIMTIFFGKCQRSIGYFEKLIRKLYVGTRKLGATPSILKGTNDSFKHSRYLFSQKDARSLNCLNFYFKSTPHVLLGQFWKNKIVA